MNKQELLLPKKFEKILNSNREIALEVNTVLLRISNILRDNDLEFFPEYTDHGIDHVQQVLDSASRIITDKTYTVLKPYDIAVLVIAICLHDIAMHLSFDSFKEILEGKYDNFSIKSFSDKNWSILWKDYTDEVKKMNDKQLYKILGSEFTRFKLPTLNSVLEINKSDRLIIGEFIRRHHHRIAHEIAVSGNIYGKEELSIKFDEDNVRNNYIRNLAGLVARSHGLGLRETFNYLKMISPQDWSHPYGINIIYLMVVIRLADYFQIQKDRSSFERIKLKRFISPVSDLEHKKHLSTLFIYTHSIDHEAITVEVNPIDSKTFLSIKLLLNNIQNELDTSWAVLGEIYGSTNNFSIKFRRVKSNLEFSEFYDNYEYIPQKITFDSSPELPKLLISPLYSNEPTYGVRELLQNSIDACNERDDYERNELEKYTPIIKVSINIDENKYFFKIEDNGKGMTFNEINNYFLKIGASYRNSNEWKESHLDENNHSRVKRLGKFGVGILAAFLLGKSISVETRSKKDKTGYRFITGLNEEQIEVYKTNSVDFGTTITIDITKDVVDKLLTKTDIKPLNFSYIFDNQPFPYHISWNKWYKLNYPNINYRLLKGNWYSIDNSIFQNKTEWNSFFTEKFGTVYWKYFSNNFSTVLGQEIDSPLLSDRFGGRIIYNGFILPDIYRVSKMEHGSSLPSLLIDDSDNNLDISLDRRKLNSLLPFDSELIFELAKSFIKKLLNTEIHNPFKEDKFNLNVYRKVKHKFFGEKTIFYHRNGFFINMPYFTKKANLSNIVQIELGVGSNFEHLISKIRFFDNSDLMKVAFSVDYVDSDDKIHSLDRFHMDYSEEENNDIITNFEDNESDINSEKNRQYEYFRYHINFKAFFNHPSDYPMNKKAINSLKANSSYNFCPNWYTFERDSKITNILNFDSKSFEQLNFIGEKHGFFTSNTSEEYLSPIFERYLNGKLFIPYDFDERLNLFSEAMSFLNIDYDHLELDRFS